MSEETYHGVTCKIFRDKLDARIIKEYIGTLNGDTNAQSFFTKNFPITDAAGVASDVEGDAPAYTDDGTPVGTWTAYATDGSDYVITGATGEVEVQAAENQGGNAGERISIDYYFRAEVGMGQMAKIEDTRVLQEVHKLGSALVQEIKAGKRPAVKLEFDSFYVNVTEFGGILSEQDYTKKLAEYDFYMYPNGVVQGQPRIKVVDIKAEFGSMEVNIDSILLAKARYLGKAVEIDTVP